MNHETQSFRTLPEPQKPGMVIPLVLLCGIITTALLIVWAIL